LAYICVIALLQTLGVLKIYPGHYIAVLSQIWNYQGLLIEKPAFVSGIWYFGHYWSLALEEQFYFIWPLVVWLLSKKNQLRFILLLIVLMPIIRVGWYWAFPQHRGYLGMLFHTASDSILWGCLLAMIFQQPPYWLSKAVYSKFIQIGMLFLIGILQPVLAKQLGGAWSLLFGISLNALGAAYFLIVLMSNLTLQRWLSARPLVFIGTISYSLYIWQQLFLVPDWALGPQIPLGYALPALLITAWISRRFIEEPFLSKNAGR